MKRLAIIIGIAMVLLVPATMSFAWHGHGGWGWGGGIYIGPGYYPGPYSYPYPYYYPYGGYGYPGYGSPAYGYPSANCETRCYRRVVPTCRTNAAGERVCRDEVIRDCRRYCN
jgi:hypothetical protein